MTGQTDVSLDFAATLTDVRLLQTAKLLEWMLENGDADLDAVTQALNSVMDAHSSIKTLRADRAAG